MTEDAEKAFAIVNQIRESIPFALRLDELDWAVEAHLEEQVEIGVLPRDEADIVYGAFSRIFMHKGFTDGN